MVTLQDIANRVGVTRIVVSRVLNNRLGKIGVSEEKRLRILEVAKELNYTPNRSARSLATSRNRAIGLVVHQRRYETETITYSGAVFNLLKGMHLVCDPFDYRCLYSCADMRNEVSFEMPKFLKERSVDAVMIHGYVHRSVEEQLLATGLPIGHVGFNVDPGSRMPCVSADMIAAACNLLDRAVSAGISSVHLYNGGGPGSRKIAAAFLDYAKTLGRRIKATATLASQVMPDYEEIRRHGVELGSRADAPELVISSIGYYHPLLVGMQEQGRNLLHDVQLVVFAPEGYQDQRFLGTDLRITQYVLSYETISSVISRQLIDVLEGKAKAVKSSYEPCEFLHGETAPALIGTQLAKS